MTEFPSSEAQNLALDPNKKLLSEITKTWREKYQALREGVFVQLSSDGGTLDIILRDKGPAYRIMAGKAGAHAPFTIIEYAEADADNPDAHVTGGHAKKVWQANAEELGDFLYDKGSQIVLGESVFDDTYDVNQLRHRN